MLGRSRRAEAAEVTVPAVEDPSAEAEAGVREALNRLGEHQQMRQVRLVELRDLHAQREEALDADDADEAYRCDQRIARAELALHGSDRAGVELANQLHTAQERLRQLHCAMVRPRLDDVYGELAAAAARLRHALEQASITEAEAIRVGLLRETQLPGSAVPLGTFIHRWAATAEEIKAGAAQAAQFRASWAAAEAARWAMFPAPAA